MGLNCKVGLLILTLWSWVRPLKTLDKSFSEEGSIPSLSWSSTQHRVAGHSSCGKNIHHLSKHFPPYQQAYQMVLLQTLLSPLLRLTRIAVLMSSNISPRTKKCKGSGDSFQRKARGFGSKFFLPLTYNLRQIPRPSWPWLPNLFFWRVRVSTWEGRVVPGRELGGGSCLNFTLQTFNVSPLSRKGPALYSWWTGWDGWGWS